MRSLRIARRRRMMSATLGAMAIAFAMSDTAVAQPVERGAQEPDRTNPLRDPSKSNTESGYAEDRVITERVRAALDAQPDLRTAMLRDPSRVFRRRRKRRAGRHHAQAATGVAAPRSA